MNSKLKKLIALCLVLALTLGFGTPALALEQNDSYYFRYDISEDIYDGDFSITVQHYDPVTDAYIGGAPVSNVTIPAEYSNYFKSNATLTEQEMLYPFEQLQIEPSLLLFDENGEERNFGLGRFKFTDIPANGVIAIDYDEKNGPYAKIDYDAEVPFLNNDSNNDNESITNNTHDVHATVESGADEDVINVDIEWGRMSFIYNVGETVWDPETHTNSYNGDGSWEVAPNTSNHVTVTSHSNIPLNMNMNFSTNYDIGGIFTTADGEEFYGTTLESAEEVSYNSPEKAPSQTVYFMPYGTDPGITGTTILGQITVEIYREA